MRKYGFFYWLGIFLLIFIVLLMKFVFFGIYSYIKYDVFFFPKYAYIETLKVSVVCLLGFMLKILIWDKFLKIK
ncbi:hypothetical protein SAMN02910415_00590 [Basfia succiniciproducens]|nr:hypothetical protein SAMN02910415_00590 [Basfia succiniciproducens]